MSQLEINACRCKAQGCAKRATFGDSVTNIRVACFAHQDDNHVYLGMSSKPGLTCKFEGCRTLASYGDPVEGRRLYCAAHKLYGYVRVNSGRQ